MKFRHALKVLLLTPLLILGCATNGPNEEAGMLIGGILGGVLGAQIGDGSGQTAATIAGTLAGAVIGGAVGRSMDDTDRLKTGHALETVRTGVPSTWTNPDTGHGYTVTPRRTYGSSNRPCREFLVNADIDGREELVRGTACRTPDGSWIIQS